MNDKEKAEKNIFRSYNVTLDESFFSYYKPRETHYNFLENQKKASKFLDIITRGNIINAAELADEFFPKVKCDIFISHSHKDKDLAILLAKWIYDNFGLESFVDSTVWGESPTLIKKFNDEYSSISGEYYIDKVINATNHINMILITAILKEIDSAKSVFFLNTPNSISTPKNSIELITHSPWIYTEIMFTHIIEKNRMLNRDQSSSDILEHSEPLDIKMNFKLPTEHLINIGYLALNAWELFKESKENKLELLAELVENLVDF